MSMSLQEWVKAREENLAAQKSRPDYMTNHRKIEKLIERASRNYFMSPWTIIEQMLKSGHVSQEQQLAYLNDLLNGNCPSETYVAFDYRGEVRNIRVNVKKESPDHD